MKATAPATLRIAGHRRRAVVIPAAVLAILAAAAAGVLLFTWHRAASTLSYVQAQDSTRQMLNDAMFAAIADVPDAAATSENLNLCGDGGHSHYLAAETKVSGITPDRAAGAADKLAAYLRSHGYAGIGRDQTPTIHGVKNGVTVTMRYDGQQNLSFSAVTGCNVKV